MPTAEHVHIFNVQPWHDPRGFTVYVVRTSRVDESYTTLNQFAAGLCDRAAALKLPVTLTWKDGRQRGQRILTNVVLEHEEARA